MEEHIKNIKGKTEAALQTIFNLAGNDNLSNMEMKVVWKLVDTCIIPIITYAAEAWMPTKAEMEQLEKIFSNTLKIIMKTPITTPREIVQVETGMMQEKQILYLHKILKENDNSIKKSIATNLRHHWHKHICKALKY